MSPTVLCAAVLLSGSLQTDEKPTGLWVTGTHWFYFPNKTLGPIGDQMGEYAVQSFLTDHMVVVRGRGQKSLAKNPDGEWFGSWYGTQSVFHGSGGDPEVPEKKNPESGGEVWFAPKPEGLVVRFSNSTGSIKVDGTMHRVSDTSIDFFSGSWSGVGFSAVLSQDEGSKVSGSAHYALKDFAVDGDRYGTVARLKLLTKDTGQAAYSISVAWAPSDSEVRKMDATSRVECGRLAFFEYHADRKDHALIELKRQ